MKIIKVEHLKLKDSVLSPAYIKLDDKGIIQSVESSSQQRANEEYTGVFLPGLPNAHSHAFQYAFAGETEYASQPEQSNFWSWREKMYELALSISPEKLETIATMLYSEMLRKGYTSVCEFHYLHHDQSGKPYPRIAEMSARLEKAALNAGIHLCLIPIFYQRGGFDKPSSTQQRRFISHSIEQYLHLRESIIKETNCSVGWGIHSLRAVQQQDCIDLFTHFDSSIPFHLHLAEQEGEVTECINKWGQRPAMWACDHLPLNEYSSLIHCTHLNPKEILLLSEKKCNVVLCPSTEANLGDGFFPLEQFKNVCGRWSIGSDSHIGLSPFEELRWLEYQVRLRQRKRNPLCSVANQQSGDYLFSQAYFNGHMGLGSKRKDFFEVGQHFDAIGFDHGRANFKFDSQSFLSKAVYLADDAVINTVITAGEVRIENGRHLNEEAFLEDYSRL